MNQTEFLTFVVGRGLAEEPSAAIAEKLRPLTRADIKTEDVRRWFRESGIWFKSGPASMMGTFQSAIDSGQLPAELNQALAELYSSVFGDSALTLSTSTSFEIAGRFFAGWNGLVQAGVVTKKQCDAFYALDGGQPFLELTAAQVDAAKAEHAKQLAADQFRELFDRKFNELVAQKVTDGDKSGVALSLRMLADYLDGV